MYIKILFVLKIYHSFFGTVLLLCCATNLLLKTITHTEYKMFIVIPED